MDLKTEITKYWTLNTKIKRCSRSDIGRLLEVKTDEEDTVINARDSKKLRKT